LNEPPDQNKGLDLRRSDAELVAAARRGDPGSFGSLYERHYRLAVGIARRRLSDHHPAEDAAQEAFSVACRTLSTVREPSGFPQWLGSICRPAGIRRRDP
jgi:RNA polymerase sigma-70 factor (ECF subfamily)